MADKYDLTVYLCPRCHTRLHDMGEYDRDLQEMAQVYFEKIYGHNEFMRVFGKNFRR
jgi:Zn-finger nucleic acid-binding protein